MSVRVGRFMPQICYPCRRASAEFLQPEKPGFLLDEVALRIRQLHSALSLLLIYRLIGRW
jgi:hypothetical protein